MRSCILVLTVLSFMAIPIVASAEMNNESPIVSLLIDIDLPSMPSDEQMEATNLALKSIYNIIMRADATSTLFIDQGVASSTIGLLLSQIGLTNNFEFAISGENPGSTPYSEQTQKIMQTKKQVEGLKVCGENQIAVNGFMPQSYAQDENIYTALEEIGIKYDTGFKAGILFMPGHQEDVWPYKLENHGIYAVPVSTYNLSGDLITLDDSLAKEDELTSSQWYDVLKNKLDETASTDEPMVISIKTSISGTGDFLNSLDDFMKYAQTKNAKFVSAMDLVNMTMDDTYVPTISTVCSTCNSKKESNATITAVNNTTIDMDFELTT